MKVALRLTNSKGLLPCLFSLLTRWRLHTAYPHGGVVVGDTLLHSTLSKGLHQSVFNPDGWVVFDVPEVADGAALALCSAHTGARYDVFSLLAFHVPLSFRDSKSLYCFEWVWLALTGENPRFKVTPERILSHLLTLRERA